MTDEIFNRLSKFFGRKAELSDERLDTAVFEHIAAFVGYGAGKIRLLLFDLLDQHLEHKIPYGLVLKRGCDYQVEINREPAKSQG